MAGKRENARERLSLMREQELEQIVQEILEQAKQEGRPLDQCPELFEERLAELFKARYAPDQVQRSPEAEQAGLDRLLEAVREDSLPSPEATEMPPPSPNGRWPVWQRLTRGIRERTAKPETGTPLMIFHWKTLGVAALALVLILVGLFWWRGAQNGGIRPVQDVVIIPPDQTSPEPEPPAPPKPKEPEEPQEPERTEGPPSVDPAPPPTPEEAGEEKGPPRTGPRAPSPPAEERQP